METPGGQKAEIRRYLSVGAGSLAFALGFLIVERAEQWLLIPVALTNLYVSARIGPGGHDSFVTTIVVAWVELGCTSLIAFLIGRAACRCVAAQILPGQIRLAVVALVATAILIGLTAAGEYSASGWYVTSVLLVTFVGLTAYISRLSGRLAPATAGSACPTFCSLPLRATRWTLATATIILGVVGIWFPRQLDWSRQRREAIEREDVRSTGYTQLPLPPPLSLRLIGEHEVPWLLFPRDTRDNVEVARLKSLFPESEISETTSWPAWWAESDAEDTTR